MSLQYQSVRLKCEPASEPLHISVKYLVEVEEEGLGRRRGEHFRELVLDLPINQPLTLHPTPTF